VLKIRIPLDAMCYENFEGFTGGNSRNTQIKLKKAKKQVYLGIKDLSPKF